MYKWMPVINVEGCDGCGLCVESCGPRSIAIENGVAVLAAPDTCGSEEHCIGVCPQDLLRMEWLPFSGDESRGQWREVRE